MKNCLTSIFLGTFVIIFIPIVAADQYFPQEQWNRTFGGIGNDEVKSIIQTYDGGYILVSKSEGTYGFDAWLIKTDANGNQQWGKTFGGLGDDWANSVQQTSDGGFILAGVTNSFGAGGSDAWLVKTDANGNEQWSNTFGEKSNEYVYSVQQTLDGGYILAGDEDSSGFFAGLLIKTDEKGNEIWRSSFMGAGGPKDASVFSVQQTTDRGYILAGMSGFGSNMMKAWLIKNDKNGKEDWSKTFGGTVKDLALSVQQTLDGGYVLAGATTSFGGGGTDVWLIKTDAYGNQLWSKTFGGPNNDYGYSVQQTSDGGYILAGWTESYGAGSSDAWLVKTDVNGNQQWSKTFGGTGSDKVNTVRQTFDGDYILAGVTDSYGTGNFDAWLIKVFYKNDTLASPPITQRYNTTSLSYWDSIELSNLYMYVGVAIVFLAAIAALKMRRKSSETSVLKPDTKTIKTMNDLEILRGYSVLPNNDIKFGIRLINNTSFVITDADVILDYPKTLFSTKDSEIHNYGNLAPNTARTAIYVLKPLGCIHNENINAIISYTDATGKKHALHMRPKEVHCVCPFLKEKPLSEGEYSRLAASSEFVQEGIAFKGISVEELSKFMGETCRHMLYKVREYDLEGKKVIYLSGESLGEKAYYLLTAVIQEYKGLTQVLLRAHSDKKYGLNGFMNEMADSVRHLVGSVQSAKEIGIIENTQVINIIDSVVQRTSFEMGEGGSAQVNIRASMMQRSTIGASARKCPNCGREVEANEKFCLECGAKL